MGLNYQPSDDTPDKVETAIRKYQELSGFDKNTEAYARSYARCMMEQADGLARWGEYDEAERLAGRAAAMRLAYGPYEQKPQDMLQRIVDARRQANVRTAAAPSAAGYASALSEPSPMAARRKAVELVRQARDAMAAGQLNQAESLAHQAEQLRLPETAYAPGEDRPALVLLDIRQLRQQSASGVVPASAQYSPSGAGGDPDRSATRAVYDAANDPTRNVAASNQQPSYSDNSYGADPRLAQNPGQPPRPAPAPTPAEPIAQNPVPTNGMMLFQQGEAALRGTTRLALTSSSVKPRIIRTIWIR